MRLAERRKALGYSQETFAQALGVDRTTVGRWESNKNAPQPPLRPKLAEVLQVDLAELDALVAQPQTPAQESAGTPPSNDYGSGDTEEMIRREFLRAIAVIGTLAPLPADDREALNDAARRGTASDFLSMNGHLWQVYQLARSKRSMRPIVSEQLSSLNRTLTGRSDAQVQPLCSAAGDLFQLAGELAFDSNRYTDATDSYALAASASKEAGAFDLWACALVRHAYVDVYEHRFKEATDVLSAAERVAKRGDSSLATRHWVASVQAEAHAGLGDLTACERALDEAEKVTHLAGPGNNGGWLRFDGSRLAEERGARYVQLGRLDLAERALKAALGQGALAQGQSFRRRGVVLADLAAIGAKRRDPDQVITFGHEALQLARESSSGYVARRLQTLRAEFGPLARDSRVAELGAEIGALSKT
ncbi:helix-turn-helix transcriptional regulator [Streptomyces sp. ISL-100]|uniref:helix-turn-helix transcriptional regulator n=1 Tax=Streptomyces sp. ISL-100 TaxID=2819173 RepID=UPI001BEBA7B6|nr:helix-turn-helix transcriptional regulator [Streptomyces sp. ISL-100]MBT2398662.1 helix-turn-helix transcriptional regulator [Streptomyces sp. ISL-100]